MIDSISVEELDWSAESQVLIPAEHFWCDFKCRPWAKNASPNTNDMGTVISYTSKLLQPRWKYNFYELCFHSLEAPFSSKEVHIMNVQVIGGWWLVFGSRCAFKAEPAPQGQFETSQLELSLKSHAFEKFVYLHIHSLDQRPAHKYEINIV